MFLLQNFCTFLFCYLSFVFCLLRFFLSLFLDKTPRPKSTKARSELNQRNTEQSFVEKPAPINLQRKKGETAEEKAARKKAVKEQQRERRRSKKEHKESVKREETKLKKTVAGQAAQPLVRY